MQNIVAIMNRCVRCAPQHCTMQTVNNVQAVDNMQAVEVSTTQWLKVTEQCPRQVAMQKNSSPTVVCWADCLVDQQRYVVFEQF